MITTILTLYKRERYLDTQVQHIRKQTVGGDNPIWLWVNKDDSQQATQFHDIDELFVSTRNHKFFGRFAAAALVDTRYVAIFDDDTIPGPQWFENCVNTMQMYNDKAILGTTGVVFDGDAYDPHHKIGWNGSHLSTPAPADLVGHAWFTTPAIARMMWNEQPMSWDNGEDMHLSYCASKQGIPTIVPPHPRNNQAMWGSIAGFELGNDEHASHRRFNHAALRNKIAKYLITEKEWNIVRNQK